MEQHTEHNTPASYVISTGDAQRRIGATLDWSLLIQVTLVSRTEETRWVSQISDGETKTQTEGSKLQKSTFRFQSSITMLVEGMEELLQLLCRASLDT